LLRSAPSETVGAAADPGDLEDSMSEASYAGDVSPSEAWQILEQEPDAVMVDCRTDMEWRHVGLPDLSGLGKETLCVQWQRYPDMSVNEAFAKDLAAQGVRPEQTVLFLCRSGVRSMSAAIAMTARGYRRCLNVSGGFEGPHDAERHRGRIAGWKASGLPWVQD